jgi:hypothetical protein
MAGAVMAVAAAISVVTSAAVILVVMVSVMPVVSGTATSVAGIMAA